MIAACQALPALPDDVDLLCDADGSCPDGRVCVVDDRREVKVCLDAATDCLDNTSSADVDDGDGDVLRFAADGSVCGNGTGICVERRCVERKCGDGFTTSPEECDDGTRNSDSIAGACRTSCALASCGDAVVDPGEDCDDGDAGNSDELADACRTTCKNASCGDGVVDDEEECDNGQNNNDDEAGACRTNCKSPFCGDRVVDPGEECDDGNDDGVVCNAACVSPRCGDGVVDQGESCDDGNALSGDGCRGDCSKVEVCGDAFVDLGEACDDGNDNPRDGCAVVFEGGLNRCAAFGWQTAVVVGEGPREPTRVGFSFVQALALDSSGGGDRLLVANAFRNRVHRVDLGDCAAAPLGVSVVAGNGGASGFAGDGGPATKASLFFPMAATFDSFGRVLVSDSQNGRVRRIDADGVITTILQGGRPRAITRSSRGEIFFVDEGTSRILRLDAAGGTQVLPSVGTSDDFGRGGGGVVVAADGALLFAEPVLHRVSRFVPGDQRPTTYAGTGTAGAGADGIPAVESALNNPTALALDGAGNLYIADTENHRVRRVGLDGFVTTVAGFGQAGFSGDGEAATGARLNGPQGLAVDRCGRLYISDSRNNRVRRVDSEGVIDTVVGEDGDPDEPALSRLASPVSIAFDLGGRLVVSDRLFSRIRRIEADGVATTIVGNAPTGFGGDGGPARTARLNDSGDIAYDTAGRLALVDTDNRRVRLVDPQDVIATVAGNGNVAVAVAGAPLDGAVATEVALNASSVAFNAANELFIADRTHHAVLKIDGDGRLRVIAGNNGVGAGGDGGPATAARLNSPSDLAFVDDDVLLVVDSGNHVVRRVDVVTNTITRFAGTGVAGFSGDDGRAVNAQFSRPSALAVASDGEVCIVDAGNRRIRCVGPGDDVLRRRAGTGSGLGGDGGPALEARLGEPVAIAFDPFDRLVIANDDDEPADYIRRVELDGAIHTIAGALHPPGNGPVAFARFYGPRALVAVPDVGLLGVGAEGRVQRWDRSGGRVDVVIGYPDAAPSAQSRAVFAPLLRDAQGLAWDDARRTLYVAERGSGVLRVVGLDPDGDGVVDDPDAWTHAVLPTPINGLAGIAVDPVNDVIVAVDAAAHCVERLDHEGNALDVVLGVCGVAGSQPGFLQSPTQVALSPSTGSLYIADTGNHRVLRVEPDGSSEVVVGDGSVSSAGEGRPARRFPVNAPHQLALDSFGNLWVTSTTTVRLIANVDGDADADGDDLVLTPYGAGDRSAFPEADSFCLEALVIDDDDDVYVADACQGILAHVTPAPR